MIAIIEDDASVRTATQSLVRSLGFAACTFACAEEFMQSPRLNEASCVIADIQMPGMSGVELQTLLIAEGRKTPFIFMTALHDEVVRARAIKAVALCFLSKPEDGHSLIDI